MKKEKWMLREIARWQHEGIITAETADILKKQYEPRKSMGFLIVLFSVIGTLFIGMGIILIGANNWWYKLPVAVRTVIAFLPLVISQALLFYVLRHKTHSTAFRESAAIFNMAGVFSTIAIVGQIFHLPGDFTNYLLVCGILSLPSMLVMNAVAPLIIYFWTAINGGVCVSEDWGAWIAVILFAVGAAFAVAQFKRENSRSVYSAWITALSGFTLMLTAAVIENGDPISILFVYFLLLLSVSPLWERAGQALRRFGTAGILVLMTITTYHGMWEYTAEFGTGAFAVLTFALMAAATGFMVKSFRSGSKNVFAGVALLVTAVRIIWMFAELNNSPFDMIFTVMFNIVIFATGIYFIWQGSKNVNLVYANTGMATVCMLILLRFFDSGMSLGARGAVFLIVGIAFLLFNMKLIRMKKAKEETV